MTTGDDAPKLQIDSDWKAQAQAEKERLAEAERKAEAERAQRGPGGIPEANFLTLMSVLATQALMGLGTVADPDGRGVMVDLEGARFSIDLLGVLEEKTRGNLSAEETEEITHTLAELRARYVQLAQAIARQMSASGGATPPGPGGLVT